MNIKLVFKLGRDDKDDCFVIFQMLFWLEMVSTSKYNDCTNLAQGWWLYGVYDNIYLLNGLYH